MMIRTIEFWTASDSSNHSQPYAASPTISLCEHSISHAWKQEVHMNFFSFPKKNISYSYAPFIVTVIINGSSKNLNTAAVFDNTFYHYGYLKPK
jgi:hypothetical protein